MPPNGKLGRELRRNLFGSLRQGHFLQRFQRGNFGLTDYGRDFLCSRAKALSVLGSSMGLDVTARRRLIGGLALTAALVMLAAGETVLKGHLKEIGFLIYWLVCFLFTGIAIVVAFLDARALQHRTRREQRDLFEATLRQIENEAKTKSPRRTPPDNNKP